MLFRSSRKASKLGNDKKEMDALRRIHQITARLSAGGPFVAGLTIHQSKGREWSRVGVCLNEQQLAALARGLDVKHEEDRIVYVALTRAADHTGRVLETCPRVDDSILKSAPKEKSPKRTGRVKRDALRRQPTLGTILG